MYSLNFKKPNMLSSFVCVAFLSLNLFISDEKVGVLPVRAAQQSFLRGYQKEVEGSEKLNKAAKKDDTTTTELFQIIEKMHQIIEKNSSDGEDDVASSRRWVDGKCERVLLEGSGVDETYETPSDVESSPAEPRTVESTTADTRTSEPTTNIRNAHATTADTRTSGSTPALASVVEANRLTRSEGDIDHPTTTDDSTADESIAETSESASDAGSEIGNDFTVESPRQIKCSNGDLVIAFPNSPFAEIKYSNGDQYLGEITEVTPGVYTRHGNGALHKVNGDTYDGEWKNDLSHGKGIYTRANGGSYDGDWEEGKRHGRGVMTLGKREGHGVYTTLSGVKQYDGNWKNGKPEGRGVYTGEWTQRDSTEIPRRIEYDGEWKNGKRHGYGIERVALQFGGKMYSVYTGQWENGEKHGNCVYIDESGTKFVGEWKNGEMHGRAQIGETMSRVAIL